jgi:hypothetical protein
MEPNNPSIQGAGKLMYPAGPTFVNNPPRCRYAIYPDGPILLIIGIYMKSAIYLAGPAFSQKAPRC